jgi:hypothetical protein
LQFRNENPVNSREIITAKPPGLDWENGKQKSVA